MDKTKNLNQRLDRIMALITLIAVVYASYEFIFEKLFQCFMGFINPMCPTGF